MGTTNDRSGPPVTADPDTILANVVWIIAHLDAAGLREIDGIPVLELAKHIAVARRAAA